MSNNKKSSVEWLYDKLFNCELNIFEWQKHLEQAKEMEVAGREMSYDEGYKEGYKRALELIEWGIQQAKTK